jgi:hypothetical protein
MSWASATGAAPDKIGWKDGVCALWCVFKYAMKEPVVARQTLPSVGRELAPHQPLLSDAGITEIDQQEGQSGIA